MTPEVENLVKRLERIKERLFWLRAVWSNTLSPDVARECDLYQRLFLEVGEELKKLDADSFERIVAGHESVLLSEPYGPKPTLPLALQQWIELSGEIRGERTKSPEQKPEGYIPDGLSRFV